MTVTQAINTETAWKARATELAEVALKLLAIKPDRFGQYDRRGGATWSKKPVTDSVLKSHFLGKKTIGLGATSAEDFCRWVAVDLDNHVSEQATNQNMAYAIILRERLSKMGITCLIEDSDGKGGIHLWILFDSPVPSKIAHRFIHWLVRDYKEHGVEKIEAFPKSPSVQHTKARCGNYLRLPGKHHKRDHWSRFYGALDWMTLEESVQTFLQLAGNSQKSIPHIHEEPAPENAPRGFAYAPPADASRDEALASDALRCINPDSAYDDWLKIGQCLHFAGDPFLALWIEWSQGSKDFDEAECRDKWKTFSRDNGGVKLGTLFHIAKANGWVRPKRRHKRQGEAAGVITTDSGEDLIEEELPDNAVELTLDEKAVNDAVVGILKDADNVFDLNGQLATIVSRVDDDGQQRVEAHILSLSGLREIISQRVKFYVWAKDKEASEEIPSWQRIPRWTYEAILSRGSWPGIRPLRGIVNSPVLRADGSILQTAGYDDASGLFVDLAEQFPNIADDPSTNDVQRAVELLFDLVCDFPFANLSGQSAWLASLLTPLAREAYRGCTGPLFLFDANVRGSGKSLLADINALMVSGREATRMTAPRDDEEMRKRITALMNDSDRIVLIDNICGRFGSPAFDAALTGTNWKDRLLQYSKTVEALLRMTWYGSGNNVILAENTARRVCHIRLESPLENPEDRSGFKYSDIRKHVRQNRPKLLAAALTILRGFIVAGRPHQKLKPWGSFEGWSDLVRNAVVWSGQADPGGTRDEFRETSDSEAGSLQQMLNALISVDTAKRGLSAGEMIQIASGHVHSNSTSEVANLRESIEQFCDGSFDRLNSRHLGNRLGHFRNRVCSGMALDYSTRSGIRCWFVNSASGSGDSGDSKSEHLRMGETDNVSSDSMICTHEKAHEDGTETEPPEPPEPPNQMSVESDYAFEFGR